MINFPDGLLGFPDCHSFVLSATSHDGLFWLQSTEYEPLAFLLVDPFRHFESYCVELSDIEVARLHADRPADVAILATVTLGRDGATANLQGPIALNIARGCARQVIIGDPKFGVRMPLELPDLVGN